MGAAAFPISRLGMVRLQGWTRKRVRLIAEEEQESSPSGLGWGELGAPNGRVRMPAASRLGMSFSDLAVCVCLCVFQQWCSAGIWGESEYVFLITTHHDTEAESERDGDRYRALTWSRLRGGFRLRALPLSSLIDCSCSSALSSSYSLVVR